MTPESFYDATAELYDVMTGGETRIQRAIEQLEPLVKGLSSKQILDVGCGTGVDSLALARLGCSVIGVDSSPAMIAKARTRVDDSGLPISFEVNDLRSLESVSDDWADLTLCRGNTLPHLRDVDDLKKAIKALARVTKPDGLLVLGWLNYIPILRQSKRLVGTSGDEHNLFLRFYDFNEDSNLNFNIVAMKWNPKSNKWHSDWRTTTLSPWLADDVGMLMVGHGWGELEIASTLNRDEFDPDTSKDVFVFAARG